MSRFKNLLLICAISFLAAACTAVRPTSRDEAPPAVSAPPGMATLVLARPWHFADHDQVVAISINDKLLGRLPNQSFAYYHVHPGNIRVSGEIGILGWPRREIQVNVAPGDIRYLFWQTKEGAVHEQLNYLVLGDGKYADEIRWDTATSEHAATKLRSLIHVSGASEPKAVDTKDAAR